MWHLRDHLTACLASGRLILLNTKRDRYFALPAESTRAGLDWLCAGDGSAAPTCLAQLLGDRDGEPLTNTRRIEIALPEPSVSRPAVVEAGFRSIASVGATIVRTGVTLRTQRLGAILDRRRQLRQAAPILNPAELQGRAQTFVTARRWCPIARNCLLDSLAIDHWLGNPGGLRLVFGVIAHPFEAHCWVQSDCHVLNDSYDRVSRFEPILSV